MRRALATITILICFVGSALSQEIHEYTTLVKLGVTGKHVNIHWRNALSSRQSRQYIDSISTLIMEMSLAEKGWLELIESRVDSWNLLKDSLKVPFGNTHISDTTYVLLGYGGYDDGFTYEYQTVCFDLTALSRTYGSAEKPVNSNRMDRLFAHEYTHLLHKEWARQNDLVLESYQDSILWECIYEGIGMYRSMSKKWFPIDNDLSPVSAETFDKLYPIFVTRMNALDTTKHFTRELKISLHKNLSRGSMKQKWGALPVGVWLALEAERGDENLKKWVELGPEAIIPLAKKYLPPDLKKSLIVH